jgi:hypothetical protein
LLLTNKHIKQFAVYYLICFLLCFAWFFYNGLLLSSINPVFFLNRLDVTQNIMMLTNLQHFLIENKWLRIFFDLIYLVLPVLLVYTCIKNKKGQKILAIFTAFFNVFYCTYLSSMSFVSVEVFVAWMIVPLIFYHRTTKGFCYLLQCARLFFIIAFFSAAIWKIRAGGIFNTEEMSAILLRQHTSYLISNGSRWFSQFIGYLINHTLLSYCLYLLAFIAEFIFIVGFFTRKFDKYLILLFCLFVFFNYFLMGINYFTWLPFIGCLYFSKYITGVKD